MSASSTSSQSDHAERFRQRVREDFEAQARHVSIQEDKLDLIGTIESFRFGFISDASRRPPAESAAVQQGLDVLWHMFLETAKVLDKDDALQEKLISMLLWTKEFDSLCKSLYPSENATSSWETYGFADSLQGMWEQLLETGTASQQCNLAAFSAKALAVGICRDSISRTALWYLREALETADEAKTVALLPAAVVWMENCSYTLLTFSAIDQSCGEQDNDRLLMLGALARQANIDNRGFSMKRWLFWRRRFQELSHSSESAIAKEAKKGFMSMMFVGRNLDYVVPGEKSFQEKLEKEMGDELARSGKESVEGDDIDIKVDWVD